MSWLLNISSYFQFLWIEAKDATHLTDLFPSAFRSCCADCCLLSLSARLASASMPLHLILLDLGLDNDWVYASSSLVNCVWEKEKEKKPKRMDWVKMDSFVEASKFSALLHPKCRQSPFQSPSLDGGDGRWLQMQRMVKGGKREEKKNTKDVVFSFRDQHLNLILGLSCLRALDFSIIIQKKQGKLILFQKATLFLLICILLPIPIPFSPHPPSPLSKFDLRESSFHLDLYGGKKSSLQVPDIPDHLLQSAKNNVIFEDLPTPLRNPSVPKSQKIPISSNEWNWAVVDS